MSTTSSKQVAIQYSGVKDKYIRLPTVLVIQTGAVDRGAQIAEFSQYPDEVEYLWPPCSFLEPHGSQYLEISADGVVNMISVRVNANLRTRTVEEIVSQKKNMHLESFRYQLNEIRNSLIKEEHAPEVQKRINRDVSSRLVSFRQFVAGIMEHCESVFAQHRRRKAEEYVDDDTFRALVIQMLDTRRMARSKLNLWLTDTSLYVSWVHKLTLRQAHLKRISSLSKLLEVLRQLDEEAVEQDNIYSSFDTTRSLSSVALELCKLQGMIKISANERSEAGEHKILSAACEGCGYEGLRLLRDAGADLCSKDEQGNTALTEYGHLPTVLALHELGVDVCCKNDCGETAVMLAASGGFTDVVMKLQKLRADISAQDQHGGTALMAAAGGGHQATVLALLESNADPMAKDRYGGTAIMFAAGGGHTKTVLKLLDLGADVLVKDDNGWCAITYAAAGQHTQTVAALKAVGVEIPEDALSPEPCDCCCWKGCMCGGAGRVRVKRSLQEPLVTSS